MNEEEEFEDFEEEEEILPENSTPEEIDKMNDKIAENLASEEEPDFEDFEDEEEEETEVEVEVEIDPEADPLKEEEVEEEAEEVEIEAEEPGEEEEAEPAEVTPEPAEEEPSSRKNEIMSERDMKISSMLETWACRATERFENRLIVNTTGYVEIGEDATGADIRGLVAMFDRTDELYGKQTTAMRLAMGRMVLEISAREERDRLDVIDELGIANVMGRSARSVDRWAAIVAKLRPEDYHEGLTISHYEAATEVAAPEKASEKKKFNKERGDVLREAASDPKAHGKSWVKDAMRNLQEKYSAGNAEPKRERTDIKGLLRNLVMTMLVYRDAKDEELDAAGLLRSDLSDWIEADAGSLINLEEIEPDLESQIKALSKRKPKD